MAGKKSDRTARKKSPPSGRKVLGRPVTPQREGAGLNQAPVLLKKARSANMILRQKTQPLPPQLRQTGFWCPPPFANSIRILQAWTSRADAPMRGCAKIWAYQHTPMSMLVRPNLRNLFSTGTYVNVHGDDTQRMNAITVTVTKNRAYSDL